MEKMIWVSVMFIFMFVTIDVYASYEPAPIVIGGARGSSKEPINLNNFSSFAKTGKEIIIMGQTGETLKPIVNIDTYQNNEWCQGTVRYMWDNHINMDNPAYHLDRQTCQLLEKVDYREPVRCTKRTARPTFTDDGFGGWITDFISRIRHSNESGCTRLAYKWVLINLSRPIAR